MAKAFAAIAIKKETRMRAIALSVSIASLLFATPAFCENGFEGVPASAFAKPQGQAPQEYLWGDGSGAGKDANDGRLYNRRKVGGQAGTKCKSLRDRLKARQAGLPDEDQAGCTTDTKETSAPSGEPSLRAQILKASKARTETDTRQSSRQQICAELFANWSEYSANHDDQRARSTYKSLRQACPTELKRVAAAANVDLSAIRTQEPSTGSMGGNLYRNLSQKSAGELESMAASKHRDNSEDMDIADVFMLGLRMGSVAASMYPVRSFQGGTMRVPTARAVITQPKHYGPAPKTNQSTITGLD